MMNDFSRDWRGVISPLHSGITEEDLRASGVMNPSHRRRILENLPKNWNWHAEMRDWYAHLELEEVWDDGDPRRRNRPEQISRASTGLFIDSIDTVTADYLRQHGREWPGAGSACCALCLFYPSILTVNKRRGWYEWETCGLLALGHKYWLNYQGLVDFIWNGFSVKIVPQFAVFTGGLR